MDRTALQHEGVCVVTRHAKPAAHFPGKPVVLRIVGVQTVKIAAPGIEFPVDPPQAGTVGHKGRSRIPCPCVVGRNLPEHDQTRLHFFFQHLFGGG